MCNLCYKVEQALTQLNHAEMLHNVWLIVDLLKE